MDEQAGLRIGENCHLVEKILQFCKTPTLLQARLVCRLWAEEAARILRKRGISIAFRCIEDIEEFITVPRPTSQKFTHYLIDIPSSDAQLENEEYEIPNQIVDLVDVVKEDMEDLKMWYNPLVVHTETGDGEQVERLENGSQEGDIDEESYTPNVELTNLESLQLLSNYVHPVPPTSQQRSVPFHRMPKYFSFLSTPKLRSLAVQHLRDTDCASITLSLIKSSRCQLEFLKVPAKLFQVISQDMSVSLASVRELDLTGIFHGFSCSTNETLSCIVKRCPRLKKLGIEFSFRVTQPNIQELWESLAGTLEELKCTIQDRNLLARQIVRTDFIFPKMHALKNLQMRWSNPGLVYYIDQLPALKDLMLDTVWTRKIQGNLFPQGQVFQEGANPFGNLVSLKVTEILNAVQVKVFSSYFPNLRMLGCSFDSNEALRTVYECMGSLKWLIIERRSNITEAGGLLGLEETELTNLVNELTNGSDAGNEIEKLGAEPKREFASIAALKDLETLELCQLGVTWRALVFGVQSLSKLKTLVIQSKAFKELPIIGSTNDSPVKNLDLLQLLAPKLTDLQQLILWIRNGSERLSDDELGIIEREMSQLKDINVFNHSLCGI